MSPKAEVYIPTGRMDDFRKAVAGLDGNILRVRKDTLLAPNNITPLKMVKAIQEIEPSFVTPKLSESSIYSSLRDLPPDRCREILVEFCRTKVEPIPDPEKFVSFVMDIMHIKFPKTPEKIDQSRLQQSVDQYFERLGRTEPVKVAVIRENVGENFSLFSMTSGELLTLSSHSLPLPMLPIMITMQWQIKDKDRTQSQKIDYYNARTYTWRLINTMARSIVNGNSDRQDYHHIGEPLIEMYRYGAIPLGEKDGKFAVFVPRSKSLPQPK